MDTMDTSPPTTMRAARRAYRKTPPSERQGVSFKQWVRKTFPPAPVGKLAALTGAGRSKRGRRAP